MKNLIYVRYENGLLHPFSVKRMCPRGISAPAAGMPGAESHRGKPLGDAREQVHAPAKSGPALPTSWGTGLRKRKPIRSPEGGAL